MRYLFIFWILSTFIVGCNSYQPKKIKLDNVHAKSKYYEQAYQEIVAMLEGKRDLSFKRAVFLVEWAYTDGNLNYQQFCTEIEGITKDLQQFIHQKGIEQYKTAGNYALFEFFTKPNQLNNYQPFTYNFQDFHGGKNWQSIFVTKLLKTHKGQCRSLPYLYKILADELQTTAHLAIGPNHCYIKHIGEEGKWVNVELTNGNFATDAWMMTSMDISTEAIKNRIYMDPLSLEESVAYCLTELGQGYKKKYGYKDNVALAYCDATLAYYPHSIHTLMLKHNILNEQGLAAIQQVNPMTSTEMVVHHKLLKDTQKKIDSLGFRQMSMEKYEQWQQKMEAEKQKLSFNQ